MYIRIQDQSIRFRLSMQEAERVLTGEILCDHLPLTVENALTYQVCLSSNDNRFEYKDSENKLILHINEDSLTSEISTRPSKKGILFYHQIDQEKTTISLEINLKNKQRN